MLPKSISDKVQVQSNANKDDRDNGNAWGKNGKQLPWVDQDNKDKQDLIYDNDKDHHHWKVKESENFSKIFYSRQKECPRTSDGKLICMKFFLCGVCVKSIVIEFTIWAQKIRRNFILMPSPAGRVHLSRIFEAGHFLVGSRLFVPMPF